MGKEITEGTVTISCDVPKIVSKDMPVFYNPEMELNRTLSLLVLQCEKKDGLNLGLPMEASGIRGIRFLKELSKGKISSIHFNDLSEKSIEEMKKNIKRNEINDQTSIYFSSEDANLFLLNSKGFDYIDIDPFGTPNPFLDSAIKRISRDGLLAVTATDTAALSGTYPKAGLRKYWAHTMRGDTMHEEGVRILIRKCQLLGAQYDKALIPIYTLSRLHYFRIFFRCKKGKSEVDKLLGMHDSLGLRGPMWMGRLWDENLANNIYGLYGKKEYKTTENLNIMRLIVQESAVHYAFFYSLPTIAKENKLSTLPKIDLIIKRVEGTGYKASRTHFECNSIRTNVGKKEFVKIVKGMLT